MTPGHRIGHGRVPALAGARRLRQNTGLCLSPFPPPMNIVEVRHPLVQHKIGLMRNAALSTKDFRELANELGTLPTWILNRTPWTAGPAR